MHWNLPIGNKALGILRHRNLRGGRKLEIKLQATSGETGPSLGPLTVFTGAIDLHGKAEISGLYRLDHSLMLCIKLCAVIDSPRMQRLYELSISQRRLLSQRSRREKQTASYGASDSDLRNGAVLTPCIGTRRASIALVRYLWISATTLYSVNQYLCFTR